MPSGSSLPDTGGGIIYQNWLIFYRNCAARHYVDRDRPRARHRRGTETAMELQEQTVIVTGGASGIGKATALLLAREGARVFIGDVDEAGGRAAAAEGALGPHAIEYLPLDLTDNVSIDDFVAALHRRVERADGLVNGAGWDQIQPFLE